MKSQDELLDFWRYSKEQNRLAGSYWAILTHPLASPSLCSKIFGEVHMLSHLATLKAGHSRQKLRRQQEHIEVLREALQLARGQAKQEASWRDEEIAQLRVELEKWKDKADQLQQALNRIVELESRKTRNDLGKLTGELTQNLKDKSDTCLALTAENQELNRVNRQLQEQLAHLQAIHGETTLENQAMEQILRSQPPGLPCDSCQCKDCPGFDLCGRCVLYVGGQNSLVPRYRQIVEDCGGRFIYHDGGKEEQRAKLGKMLSQADAVICPVNCVSHDACLRAKRFCKYQAKPFIAMRSAGLSALARSLERVAAHQPISTTRNH